MVQLWADLKADQLVSRLAVHLDNWKADLSVYLTAEEMEQQSVGEKVGKWGIELVANLVDSKAGCWGKLTAVRKDAK
mgnify:CR=1 FL=1